MIYRVPSNFPGAGRRVYPGFLQHTGFVAMNPDHHAKQPLRLLQGPDQGRRRQRRGAPQVLRRVQRRARHGRRLLPGNHQDRVPGLQPGQRHLGCEERGRQDRARAPAGHQDHGPAVGRRRTRRHLRLGPDRGRARPSAAACPRRASSTSRPRAPATTASSAAAAGATSSTRQVKAFILAAQQAGPPAGKAGRQGRRQKAAASGQPQSAAAATPPPRSAPASK